MPDAADVDDLDADPRARLQQFGTRRPVAPE
jgi:hypothetical protein